MLWAPRKRTVGRQRGTLSDVATTTEEHTDSVELYKARCVALRAYEGSIAAVAEYDAAVMAAATVEQVEQLAARHRDPWGMLAAFERYAI